MKKFSDLFLNHDIIMISWFKKRLENFFILSNEKKWKCGTCIYISKKKLKFNVSGNNTTLAEFLVFEVLGYLLRFHQDGQKFLNFCRSMRVSEDEISKIVFIFRNNRDIPPKIWEKPGGVFYRYIFHKITMGFLVSFV